MAEDDKTVSPASAPLHEIPVGQQTIALSPAVASHLTALAPADWPDLIASRVWFERKRGKLLLHLGDVEAGRFDE